MNPIINHLIQLQELHLIRVEQAAQRGGHMLEELNASIQTLTEQLPPDIRATVAKMQKRDPVMIVPVCHAVCTGCGMRIPTSLVQAVRIAEQINICPTCTRMLFYPEGAPRQIAKAPSRTEPRRVGITRFSSPSLMLPRLAATDRDGVIRELAFLMKTQGFVDDEQKLVEGALRREAIVSTAVEHGLAFPHVRGVEGGGLTLALGISPKGVRFDPSDKTLTRIVFFVAIPTAASGFYLKLLAGLAETFSDPETRKALMAEDTPEGLWKTLVKLTKRTVS